MTPRMHFILWTMHTLHKSTWAARVLEEQGRETKKHQTFVRNRSRVCLRIENDFA